MEQDDQFMVKFNGNNHVFMHNPMSMDTACLFLFWGLSFSNSFYILYLTMTTAGGSELFNSYEQDFQSITDSIKLKIEQHIPGRKGGR